MEPQDVLQETCQELTEELTNIQECEVCNGSSPYRTISGCCNNLLNKNFGRTNQAFTRLMPAAYSDSRSLPRGGLEASSLPNARKISATVHRGEEPAGDPTVTVMLMQFGQFLDHDITLTPEQGM